MPTHLVRARASLHLAAAVGLVLVAPALGGQDPTITLDRVGTETRISLLGGPVFRATGADVRNARVIALPGGAAVALWEERGADGVARSFYGVSNGANTVFRARETDYRVHLRYAAFDPKAGEPGVPAGLEARAGGSTHLVQFVAPPQESMRKAIRAVGGTVHQFLADHTHIVRLPAGAREQVAAMPFVRWVGPLHTAYKLEEPILARAAGDAGRERSIPARYGIQLVERGPAPQEVVAAKVRALGGEVNGLAPQSFRMEASLDFDGLLQVAAMDEVLFIDRWGPPAAQMNLAREISGANFVESTLGFNGQGVRGEVLDFGMRETHLAFQNPPPLFHTANFPLDPGHGTPVYGIVFGNGIVVPEGRGVLPGRERGIYASVYWANLVDRRPHIQQLLTGTYQGLFQTNSWISTPLAPPSYATKAALLDDIVFDVDFLILHSQGNYGSQNPPQTTGPEPWAKNIISVGAFEHKDTLQREDDTWNFTATTGPASDGRIKPDVSHFYDKVLCPSDLTNTSYTPDMGGTSAACPITAGHCGLIYQMWHEQVFSGFGGGSSVFADRPHPTTIKALLINTAFQYPFTTPQDDLSRDKQGWGTTDLKALVQSAAKTYIVNETDVITANTSKIYALEVAENEPRLKITMVYCDPAAVAGAGVHRINDLSLKVTSPGGAVYWGNNGLKDGVWSTPGGDSNDRDNVENVFVQNPQPGFWMVEVLAEEINMDGHVETTGLDADFSLVAHPVEFSQSVRISLPAGTPTLVAPGVPVEIDVKIDPGFQTPNPSTAKVRYRYGLSGQFLQATMEHVFGPDYRAIIPAPACGQPVQFYFECAGDGGAVALEPITAPQALYKAEVGTTVFVVNDNFEEDNGWTVVNTLIQDGPWERGVPSGTGAPGEPTADFDGSGKCWVTGLADGSDVDGGPTVLTSPAFALSGQPDARVSYARWAYTNEVGALDNLQVAISNNNGGSWTNVESVGDLSAQWIVKSFRVGDIFPSPGNQVRLRYTIKDLPLNSTTEGGLDAFKITTVACSNPCYPDCNGVGGLTIADFGCFQTKFVAGDPYADCNGVGGLTIADFGCFQTKFVAGCP